MNLHRSILAVRFVAIALALAVVPTPAGASVGEVLSHQRITEGGGGFVGPLDIAAHFGVGLANIGDLDDDGVADIAVGDWDDYSNRGAVWIVFLNSDGTVKSEQKIDDEVGGFAGVLDADDYFGESVAGIGDINGDGVEDIAVGAGGDDDGGRGRGAVWLLALNTDGSVKAHQKISDTEGFFDGLLFDGDSFGTDVTAMGDLDNNGFVDLAVGAAGDNDGGEDNGAAWILFLGPNGIVQSEQKISAWDGNFTGTLTGDYFGAAVASLDDLDQDGVDDLAVGATGAVWILFLNVDGTVKSHQKISATEGNFTGTVDDFNTFGDALAAVGDLDCDGVVDIAVGDGFEGDRAPDPITAEGAVWILLLNADGTVKTHQKISDSDGNFAGTLGIYDHLGYAVAPLGDLDGDGTPDLAAAAPMADGGVVWMLFLEGGCAVPAALQGFDASWAGDHVAVAWRLIDVTGALAFEVSRKASGEAWFTPVDGATVTQRDDEFVFEDHSAVPGQTYRYRVVVTEDGEAVASFETSVKTPAMPFALGQNEPNPFNPSTRIPFTLESDTHVTLEIYDVSGRRVVTLVDRRMAPGTYSESWDGRDASGNAQATGVYFYRLTAGNHAIVRKAMLLK